MKLTDKTRSTISEAFKAALVLAVFGGGLWLYGRATYTASVEASYKAPPSPKDPGAWLTTPWTASDAPYIAMRMEIVAKIKSGTHIPAVLAQERLNAMEHPKDLGPQTRWLYVAVLASPDGENFDHRALPAVASLDPGNIAIVARTRWLAVMLTQQNEDHPALQPLGYRLMKAYPKDRSVRIHLIYDLCAGRPGPASMESVAKASELAQTWVANEPSNPSAHSALGYVWETYYHEPGPKRFYAQKAIDEYKEYLRLAPPGDEFRPGAEILVKGFTKRLPTMRP